MEKIKFGRVLVAGLVVALVFLFLEIVVEGTAELVLGVCASIRPRFRTFLTAAFATCFVFLGILALFAANQVNLGTFPLELILISFAFNILELPPAVIAGGYVYDRNVFFN